MTEAYPSLATGIAKTDVLQLTLRRARIGLVGLPNASVGEIHCDNVLQYLTGRERVDLFDEMYRVLEVGGRVRIIVPYFSHPRAFAHPLTQWPPFSDLSFWFLDKAWRSDSPGKDVPGLECDFEVTALTMEPDASPELGYAIRPQAWRDDAGRWYNGVIAQMTVWLTKR